MEVHYESRVVEFAKIADVNNILSINPDADSGPATIPATRIRITRSWRFFRERRCISTFHPGWIWPWPESRKASPPARSNTAT